MHLRCAGIRFPRALAAAVTLALVVAGCSPPPPPAARPLDTAPGTASVAIGPLRELSHDDGCVEAVTAVEAAPDGGAYVQWFRCMRFAGYERRGPTGPPRVLVVSADGDVDRLRREVHLLAAEPDGTLYGYDESDGPAVVRRDPDGRWSEVIEVDPLAALVPDGTPVGDAAISHPTDAAVARDGSVLVAWHEGISRISAEGSLSTVVRTQLRVPAAPPTPLVEGATEPVREDEPVQHLVVASDGTVCAIGEALVRVLGPDGLVTVASAAVGTATAEARLEPPTVTFEGGQGPRVRTTQIVGAAAGPVADVLLLVSDGRVLRFDPAEGLTLVVGGSPSSTMPAEDAALPDTSSSPAGIAVQPDGDLLVALSDSGLLVLRPG